MKPLSLFKGTVEFEHSDIYIVKEVIISFFCKIDLINIFIIWGKNLFAWHLLTSSKKLQKTLWQKAVLRILAITSGL